MNIFEACKSDLNGMLSFDQKNVILIYTFGIKTW